MRNSCHSSHVTINICKHCYKINNRCQNPPSYSKCQHHIVDTELHHKQYKIDRTHRQTHKQNDLPNHQTGIGIRCAIRNHFIDLLNLRSKDGVQHRTRQPEQQTGPQNSYLSHPCFDPDLFPLLYRKNTNKIRDLRPVFRSKEP